jgi:hypothetical protein
MMIDNQDNTPPTDRDALELAQTAKSRFETTEAAAETYQLDIQRIKECALEMLDTIHRGKCQQDVFWVLEITQAMITAVMAVNGDPLPVSEKVDPASYAMAALRDLSVAAAESGRNFTDLENAAVNILRNAEENSYSNIEAYWATNRATAAVELGWARSLGE